MPSTGLRRDSQFDKFYTRIEIVDICSELTTNLLSKYYLSKCLLVEPSADT